MEELLKKSFWEEGAPELGWAKEICQEGFPATGDERRVESEKEACYVYPTVLRDCLNPWCSFLRRADSISPTWPLSWTNGFSAQQVLFVTTVLQHLITSSEIQ